MSLYKGTQFIAGTPDMTDYMTTDDLLKALYPVGSIYIGTQSTCPLATLISGSTWELVSSGRVLQGADNDHTAGTTIAAGLPNITGTLGGDVAAGFAGNTGAFSSGIAESNVSIVSTPGTVNMHSFDASRSSSIYGNSNTVQPPAYVVNIWRRTA